MAKQATSETPTIHLGDWLEFFGIGASEAARIAGVSQGYISNIAAGRKKNINVMILLPLSEHMGVTVNDFFRPLPSKTQLATLSNLSSKARDAILAKQAQGR